MVFAVRAYAASPPNTSLLSEEPPSEANPQPHLDTDHTAMRRTEAADLARQLASPKAEAVAGGVSFGNGGGSPITRELRSATAATSPATCRPTAAHFFAPLHPVSGAASNDLMSAAAAAGGGGGGGAEGPLTAGAALRVSIPANAAVPAAAPVILSLSPRSSPPTTSAPPPPPAASPAASPVARTTATSAATAVEEVPSPDATGVGKRAPAAAAHRKQQVRGRQLAQPSSPLGGGKPGKAGGWPTPALSPVVSPRPVKRPEGAATAATPSPVESPVVSPRPVRRIAAKATTPLPAAHVAKAFAAGKRNGSRVAPLKALPLQQRNNNKD